MLRPRCWFYSFSIDQLPLILVQIKFPKSVEPDASLYIFFVATYTPHHDDLVPIRAHTMLAPRLWNLLSHTRGYIVIRAEKGPHFLYCIELA